MTTKRIFLVAFCIGLAIAGAPRGAAADACYDCHDRGAISAGERSVHTPFGKENCTGCHVDHGEQRRLLLVERGNALCGACHEFSRESFIKAHGGIRGNRASCLGCHDPHRSELASLLRPGRHRPLAYGKCDSCHRYDGRLYEAEVAELCYGCHDRAEFSRPYGHAPVIEGNCLACHDPHGSNQPSLLVGRYSEERWILRGEEDYALCLNCHDAGAFSSATERGATAFRSGEENFHAIHVEGSTQSGRVSRDRGLTCRNCHAAHSSPWARLIRSDLDCGGSPCLKMEFKAVRGGGECSVSCHGTRAYSREGAAEPPAAAVSVVSPPPAPLPRRPFLPVLGEPEPEPAAEEREVAGPPLSEKDLNRRCRSCHEDDIQGFSRTHVHLPVRQGKCSGCHLDHGTDNRLVLIERKDRLCALCHDLESGLIRRAHLSYPLAGAVCTECHDPHASGRKNLLYSQEHKPFAERNCGACHRGPVEGWRMAEGVNASCRECHDGVASEPFPHSALPQRSCKGCHRPHASEERNLLRAASPDLCFLCHDRKNFTGVTVHLPVREGKCGLCHPSHGSGVQGLFTETYPLERYLDFREGAYNLCWKCHDRDSILGARNLATGFRNGELNIHSLHIRNHLTVTLLGERTSPGVTCRSCHDPHASDGPRLVREKLDCGGVPCLELEYRKALEGGTCVGGCHTEQSYQP